MKKLSLLLISLYLAAAHSAKAASVTLTTTTTKALISTNILQRGTTLYVASGTISGQLTTGSLVTSTITITSSTITNLSVSTLNVTSHMTLSTTTFSLFAPSYAIFRFGQTGLLGSQRNSVGESFFTNNYYFNVNDTRLNTGPVTIYTQDSNGQHRFYTDVTGAANSTFTATERLRISLTFTGFMNTLVGINTITPQDVIEISSTVVANYRVSCSSNGANAGIDINSLQSTGAAIRWKMGVGISSTNGTFEIRNITGGTNNLQISTVTGAVDIQGTNTNDNANPARVGYYTSSAALTAVNFPATGNYGDLVSLSLGAGDWLCSAQVQATDNGATVVTWSLGISQTAGNSSTGLDNSNNLALLPPTMTSGAGGSIPAYRKSLSATTTVYLKYRAVFSVATPQAGGELRCWKPR